MAIYPPRPRSASSGQGENENIGSWPFSCFFCLCPHPIPLLSFAADLTSRAAPSWSGSSDERSSSDSEKSEKLQDEYVLDSRIHSRPDPPWNFWNLQKHSRRGLIMIFSKITREPASRRFYAINSSGRRLVVGGRAELSEKGSLGGADTPARITGDSYKNGGEVNSTRRYSGMDVDPSGRDNHSGPGRGGDHSQEPKRLS
ncbi:hypothetical protein M9H77_00139 [Catharanthus roseus]|nr:hypothetical protein M9H77_00134 [Catharanthus roseus]KAI5640978.1 hypothetical protein M9H77_00139 [Catharanthus roseus]